MEKNKKYLLFIFTVFVLFVCGASLNVAIQTTTTANASTITLPTVTAATDKNATVVNYVATVTKGGQIYSSVVNPWVSVGDDTSFIGSSVQVIYEYYYGSTDWAQIKLSNGSTLWIDKSALTVAQPSPVQNETLVFYTATVKSSVDGLYTSIINPWTEVGYTNSINGQLVTVTAEYVYPGSSTTWVQVHLSDGTTYWLDKHALAITQPSVPQTATSANYSALLNVSDGGSLYTSILNPWTVLTIDGIYQGQTVKVSKECTSGTGTFVLITLSNGASYWINKADLTPTSPTWSSISNQITYGNDSYFNSTAVNPYRYNVVMGQGTYYSALTVGSATSSNIVTLGNMLDRTVYVRAEETVTDSTGATGTFYNISFDGNTWYWINSEYMSSSTDLTPVSHKSGTSMVTNSFNPSGQIIFQIGNTKYGDLVRQAATKWNQALGKTVFVEATSTTASSNINLLVSDYTETETGTLGNYDPNTGTVNLNIGLLGQGNNSSDAGILNVILHEMGHSLGLNHVGDWVSTSTGVNVNTTPAVSWSFGTYTDIMWATSLGDSYLTAQSTISPNDINTITMEMNNHNYYNTHPYVQADKSYSLPILE